MDGKTAMRKRSGLALAECVLAVSGVSVNASFAGEVKGPPRTGPIEGSSQNFTAAPLHAHSICAFSGLNDHDPREGHTRFHAQSYGIDVAGKGDGAIRTSSTPATSVRAARSIKDRGYLRWPVGPGTGVGANPSPFRSTAWS